MEPILGQIDTKLDKTYTFQDNIQYIFLKTILRSSRFVTFEARLAQYRPKMTTLWCYLKLYSRIDLVVRQLCPSRPLIQADLLLSYTLIALFLPRNVRVDRQPSVTGGI